ncbi:MAG: hypothetical protein LUD76_05600 [Alistipes sp.]|nr:hypothetical protein [Alistipes sp.]
MEIKNIANNLRLLADITEGWNGEAVPEIEKDMVLEGLREIYTALKYGSGICGAAAAEVTSADETHAAAAESVAVNAPARPVEDAVAGSVTAGACEAASEAPSDLRSQEAEAAFENPCAGDGTAETAEHTEHTEAAGPAGPAMESGPVPAAGEGPAGFVAPSVAQAVAGVEVMSPEAGVPAGGDPYEIGISEVPAPSGNPSEESSFIVNSPDEKEEFSQNILFDEGEIPVKPKLDRKALLSLYGDEPATVAVPKAGRSAETGTAGTVNHTQSAFPATEPVLHPAGEQAAPEQPPRQSPVAYTDPETASNPVPAANPAPGPVPVQGSSSAPAGGGLPQAGAVREQVVYIEPEPQITASAIQDSEPVQVLGDVIAGAGQTVSDVYAGQSPKADVASVVGSGRIESLRKAIGINDKFLLIRNLFDGDSEIYDSVMATLDGFGDLDDALIYIHENFNWNPDSEAVKLLVDLLTRKLS